METKIDVYLALPMGGISIGKSKVKPVPSLDVSLAWGNTLLQSLTFSNFHSSKRLDTPADHRG